MPPKRFKRNLEGSTDAPEAKKIKATLSDRLLEWIEDEDNASVVQAVPEHEIEDLTHMMYLLTEAELAGAQQARNYNATFASRLAVAKNPEKFLDRLREARGDPHVQALVGCRRKYQFTYGQAKWDIDVPGLKQPTLSEVFNQGINEAPVSVKLNLKLHSMKMKVTGIPGAVFTGSNANDDEVLWKALLSKHKPGVVALQLMHEGNSASNFKQHSSEALISVAEDMLGTPNNLHNGLPVKDASVIPEHNFTPDFMMSWAKKAGLHKPASGNEAASNAQPDKTRSIRAHMKEIAIQLLHYHRELVGTSENTHRSFIMPLVIAAVGLVRDYCVLNTEWPFGLDPESHVRGARSWSVCHWLVSYFWFGVLALEVKKTDLEKFWAQVYAELAACREANLLPIMGFVKPFTLKKPRHYENEISKKIPTYAILCMADKCYFVRYMWANRCWSLHYQEMQVPSLDDIEVDELAEQLMSITFSIAHLIKIQAELLDELWKKHAKDKNDPDWQVENINPVKETLRQTTQTVTELTEEDAGPGEPTVNHGQHRIGTEQVQDVPGPSNGSARLFALGPADNKNAGVLTPTIKNKSNESSPHHVTSSPAPASQQQQVMELVASTGLTVEQFVQLIQAVKAAQVHQSSDAP